MTDRTATGSAAAARQWADALTEWRCATTWLAPSWRHFHGLERPTHPTADDAVAAIREAGYDVGVASRPAPRCGGPCRGDHGRHWHVGGNV